MSKGYTQLSRLAIAQLTTGKKRLDKKAFTPQQLHNIQRFVNKLARNNEKEFCIVYE